MLEMSLPTLIFNVLNILVLYLFLKKFLFKPVTAMMEKRTETITANLEAAEAAKVEANRLKEEYEADIADAKSEAAKIIKAAREQAELEYNNKMVEFDQVTARKMAEAEKTIAIEREKSIQSAQDEIATIALLAASKIIGKSVNDSINKEMLGDFIKEVGAVK